MNNLQQKMASRKKDRSKIDEEFVEQFLINGSHPTESLLLPTGER